ncbi:MAG: hypothetical protein JXQ29_05070 [Planctomycetes bacterium]|nr:hypothetical protein [Planctomycetota bacterium]
MTPGLELKVIWFDDDVIELRAEGSNGQFAGAADIYVGHQQLRELADTVRGFPAAGDDSREIELGSFDPKWAGGGVRFRLACTDPAGHAVLWVQFRSDRIDASGEPESAAFCMPVDAATIDDFAIALREMRAEAGAVARLRAAGEEAAPGSSSPAVLNVRRIEASTRADVHLHRRRAEVFRGHPGGGNISSSTKCAVGMTMLLVLTFAVAFMPWGEVATDIALPSLPTDDPVLSSHRFLRVPQFPGMPGSRTLVVTLTGWNSYVTALGIHFSSWLVVLAAAGATALCWLKALSIWKVPPGVPFALTACGFLLAGTLLVGLLSAEHAFPGPGLLLTVAAFVGAGIILVKPLRQAHAASKKDRECARVRWGRSRPTPRA